MKDKIFPSADGGDFDSPPEPELAALFATCAPPSRPVDVGALLPTVALRTPKSSSFNWRTPMFRRIAALSLATCGVVALIGWLTLFGSGSQLSFAAVAEKVAQTRSVVFEATENNETERVLTVAGGPLRFELPDGRYCVVDTKSGNVLVVSPRDKTARIMLGVALLPVKDFDIYTLLRNMRNDKITPLPDETLDGRKVKVFQWEMTGDLRKARPFKVWIDPDTQLPLRAEKITPAGKPSECVMRDFVFDQPLDPALFSLEAPEGYTVTKVEPAKLQARPEPKDDGTK